MLFEFKTGDVTFNSDDRDYFENKISDILKFLGNESGDQDSVKAHVSVEKDKHHSGDRFHAKAHVTAPHGGDFVAQVNGQSLHALADKLKDTLDRQARKFHQKHIN